MRKQKRGSVALLAVCAIAIVSLVLARPAPTTATSVQPLATHIAPAISVATVAFAPPVYIEADAKHSSRYEAYEVTEYRPTKHMITAIRTGGSRDRSIVVETDGQTWVELDVATENNEGTFRVEMVDESTAELTVNGVLTARAAPDASGDWVAIAIDDTQVLASEDALDVMMDVAIDENLNAHIAVLGPFATMGVPCCGGTSAGIGFRPAWWGPQVKFVNCAGCGGICVIPEEGDTQNCNPGDGTWYDTDGIVLPSYGPGQWYKIPDSCTVTVTCIACVPVVDCLCNLFWIIVDMVAIPCGSTCTFQDCCADPNGDCVDHGAVDCDNCP